MSCVILLACRGTLNGVRSISSWFTEGLKDLEMPWRLHTRHTPSKNIMNIYIHHIHRYPNDHSSSHMAKKSAKSIHLGNFFRDLDPTATWGEGFNKPWPPGLGGKHTSPWTQWMVNPPGWTTGYISTVSLSYILPMVIWHKICINMWWILMNAY